MKCGGRLPIGDQQKMGSQNGLLFNLSDCLAYELELMVQEVFVFSLTIIKAFFAYIVAFRKSVKSVISETSWHLFVFSHFVFILNPVYPRFIYTNSNKVYEKSPNKKPAQCRFHFLIY
jgi:hypothetical protein